MVSVLIIMGKLTAYTIQSINGFNESGGYYFLQYFWFQPLGLLLIRFSFSQEFLNLIEANYA